MGRVMEWGMQILDELTNHYLAGKTLDQSVAAVVETMSTDGTDLVWLKNQVMAVRKHPEMYGGTIGHWQTQYHQRGRIKHERIQGQVTDKEL